MFFKSFNFMRIWSIHPKYLDSKGLVALWRETLLAKNVLESKTKGYKNHPQLNRFKAVENRVFAINQYLAEVYYEAQRRGYSFDKNKIDWNFSVCKLAVTAGQIEFEKNHLLNKLKFRDITKFNEQNSIPGFQPHPMFYVIDGEIEEWEKV